MPPTDLVVVLPGILGSTLRKDGHLVWAPSKGAALRAIATLGASIRQLTLPDGIADDDPADGVQPAALMPDLHVLPGIWTPLKGYDRLITRLRALGYRDQFPARDAPPASLIPFPYDWRLSCRLNATRLAAVVEPALTRWRAQGGRYADAKVTFVCHSMGGLIARWYIEQCGGAEITSKLITLGTPYRGAVRALAQLAAGAPTALGPFHLDVTAFARSLPSLYQLLPEYACLLDESERLITVTDVAVPGLDPAMTADAARFHRTLRAAESARPQSLTATHAIVGTGQPTPTTARLTEGRLELIDTYQNDDFYGDSTVPLVAACRADVPMDSNTLRRVPDKHGNLQRNTAALDEVEAVLTARDTVIKAPGRVPLRLTAPELALAGQPFTIHVTPAEPARHTINLAIRTESGDLAEARTLRPSPRRAPVTIDALPPGAYSIDLTGHSPATPYAPVSADILIWDPDLLAARRLRTLGT